MVNYNAAARVLLNTGSLKIETIRIGTTTNSNKNDIGLELKDKYDSLVRWENSRRTVSCLPSLADSAVIKTFPSFFSADRTLVLSLNLSPCLFNSRWNCLLFARWGCIFNERDETDVRDLLIDSSASDTTEEFDDCDLSTKPTPYAAHLKTNDTSTNNDHFFWHLL